MKRILFFMMLLVVMTGMLSCGKTENQIVVKGSDTELNLVSDFAAAYRKVDETVNISVTGGGSGTGIAALIDGQVNIANASRGIKEKEIENAKANGITPVPIVIATDGLSVIIHPDNSVDQLTLDQLSGIFRGEIKNWSEVGGDDKPIALYGRQSNSGTFDFFRSTVLNKQDFSPDKNRMNGNAQIVDSVKNDSTGIGYVGVGYIADENGNFVEGIKVLKVANSASDPFYLPVEEPVISGAYPLARPLYQYLNGKPEKDSDLYKFLNFSINSEEAKKIVKQNGFFPTQSQYYSLNKEAGLM